ncbi:UNVERIFIED_CONTAM: hypothetical protein FKN15_038814 [Acipenser sinensis]
MLAIMSARIIITQSQAPEKQRSDTESVEKASLSSFKTEPRHATPVLERKDADGSTTKTSTLGPTVSTLTVPVPSTEGPTSKDEPSHGSFYMKGLELNKQKLLTTDGLIVAMLKQQLTIMEMSGDQPDFAALKGLTPLPSVQQWEVATVDQGEQDSITVVLPL